MAIQFRRGLAQDFDATKLESGEPAFCTDTGEFYIGKPGTPNTAIKLLTENDNLYKGFLPTTADLNTLTGADDVGIYVIQASAVNAPAAYGILYNCVPTYGTQLYVSGSGAWTRSLTGSPLAWTAWSAYRKANELLLYSQATLSDEYLTNCTGTVSGRPSIWRNQYYEYYISGKLEITNLVRTGSAPGYRCSTNFVAGYNVVGQSGILYVNGTAIPEVVTARINTAGAFSIDMTESLGAIPNGKMIILFPLMGMIRI